MKYFVIQDGGRLPRALVRTDHRGERKLVGKGEWVESGLLAEPEPGWTVTEVQSHVFYDHVYEVIREERAGLPCLALLSRTFLVDELVNVDAVMRRRDGVEEWLDQENVWRAEERDLAGELVLPISEEELERHKWTVVRPSWFVVHDGRDYPYAVVRKIPSAEEAFTRDLRWEPSDLLGREDLRIEELDHQIEARGPLEAIEVGVRTDQQRARGGPAYFTVENRLYEPRAVFCVIRRTEAGEEVHAGRAGWVPSELIGEMERGERVLYRHLPVPAEEAEAIIAGRTGRRCFLVLDAPGELPLPIAVVRVDGDREAAFTRDLVWGPSTLLARVAEQPGLRVEELPAFSSGTAEAFMMASRLRHGRQRDEWSRGEHWYFARFRSQAAVFDLANAHGLYRTDVGSSYGQNYSGHGDWSYGGWAPEDTDRGKSDDEYLPISPDEAQRLMTVLDGR